MSDIVVYSKPRCQQCKATKRHLNKLGKKFQEIDVSQNDDARDYLLSMNFTSMPVVKMEDGTMFAGFKPSMLEK